MKTGLIQVAAIASAMILSGAALAGGENCPSKKGAHKDMSAAAGEHGKDSHGWTLSQDAVKVEPSAAADAQAQPVETTPTTQSALKI
jgi:hypothetical protein